MQQKTKQTLRLCSPANSAKKPPWCHSGTERGGNGGRGPALKEMLQSDMQLDADQEGRREMNYRTHLGTAGK